MLQFIGRTVQLEQRNQAMNYFIAALVDVHESLHGLKAKLQLAGNYWRARWKYRLFTDMTWLRALLEWVLGAVFDSEPRLD